MGNRLDIYIHIDNGGVDAMGSKLDQIISLLGASVAREQTIMNELDNLTQEVSETKSVEASAVVLLQGLKERLDAAGTNPAALKALSDDLKASTDVLAAAVAANTPADPTV
jgi:hypothetical protein